MLTAAAVLAAPRPAPAQATGGWPQDRVTIVTSLPAGSTVDITTRVFAEHLARRWGKPVVIDNRGGANGVLACQHVARARPDGLTLLATSAMTHAANPALLERLPYEPVGDFAAITQFGSSAFVVMAAKGLGVTTLGALIERLRAEPGRHNYGWGAVPAHVASALLVGLVGVDVAAVGYRGNQAAFPDLINDRLSFMSIDIVGGKPLVDRGEVHALALSAPVRHPALLAVPNCVEAGLPEFRFTTWSGLYAPRATPPEVVAQIHADCAAVFALPEAAARFAAMGNSIERLTTPAEFQAFTISEIAAWGRIIRQARISIG